MGVVGVVPRADVVPRVGKVIVGRAHHREAGNSNSKLQIEHSTVGNQTLSCSDSDDTLLNRETFSSSSPVTCEAGPCVTS